MADYGLLVDTEWCSGCHTCEIACQMEHGFPVGQTGILLNSIGPWEYDDGKWVLSYIPALTAQCDACVARTEMGKLPTCVQHCQARCMEYGTLEELSSRLRGGSKQVLFVLP